MTAKRPADEDKHIVYMQARQLELADRLEKLGAYFSRESEMTTAEFLGTITDYVYRVLHRQYHDRQGEPTETS